MECESELLRAELRRVHALLAWTHNKQAEDALVRQIEEAEERLRKIGTRRMIASDAADSPLRHRCAA